MKKNAMLKIAAGLMVAVLLTTCAISSTFAKYTASGNDAEATTARAAYWGLTITTAEDTNNPLFKTSYTGDTGMIAAAAAVAPGTTNTGKFTTTVEGTAEVSFKLVPKATVTLGSGWGTNCPLVFTVNGVNHMVGTGSAPEGTVYYANTEALATGVAGAMTTDGTLYFEANQSDFEVADLSISWTWAFGDDVNDNAFGALDNADDCSVAVTFGYDAAQTDVYNAG